MFKANIIWLDYLDEFFFFFFLTILKYIVFYIIIIKQFFKIDFQICSLFRTNSLCFHLFFLLGYCENHWNMNNKVNEFHYLFFIFKFYTVALKHMKEGSFFKIKCLDTILFLKILENHFQIHSQICPMNLYSFPQ